MISAGTPRVSHLRTADRGGSAVAGLISVIGAIVSVVPAKGRRSLLRSCKAASPLEPTALAGPSGERSMVEKIGAVLWIGIAGTPPVTTGPTAQDERKYLLERVDDAAVVQLYADGFEKLPREQRVLVWHLYQAALAGRDIYIDQRSPYALELRDLLEETLVATTRSEGDGDDPND